jgi:formate dehydrogenase maturation protein FdhE
MTQASVTTNRFADRRRRAAELKERYGTAAEVLSFYAHILEVQESAFGAASTALPEPENVAAYAAEYVLPQIVDVSTAVGPPQLVQSVLERFEEADFEDVLSRWLRSEALDGTDRFLARASTAPVLAALGRSAGIACRRKAGDRGCPQCGGLPQVGFFAASTENFVTAHRYLECSRCAHTWAFARMRCANCGETERSVWF